MNDTEMGYFKEALKDFKIEHQRYLDAKFEAIMGIITSHEGKIKCLENNRIKQKIYSGLSGFVGGFIAVLGKALWK